MFTKRNTREEIVVGFIVITLLFTSTCIVTSETKIARKHDSTYLEYSEKGDRTTYQEIKVETPSVLSRQKRSPLRRTKIPLDKICNLTEIDLTGLSKATEAEIKNYTTASNNSLTAIQSTSPCSVASKYTTNMASYVKQQTGLLNEIENEPIEGLLMSMLRNDMIFELEELNEVIGKFEETYSNRTTTQTRELRRNLLALAQEALFMLADNYRLNITGNNIFAESIAALVRSGYFDNDRSFKLNKGTSKEELIRIVELSYDGDLDNFCNVLEFIIRHSCYAEGFLIPALFKAMKDSNHSSNPEMVLLTGVAKNECPKELVSFIAETKNYTDNTLNSWANMIAEGNYERVAHFFNIHPRSWESDVLNEVIPYLVRDSFTRHKRHTMAFVGHLVYVDNAYYGFKELIRLNNFKDPLVTFLSLFLLKLQLTKGAIADENLRKQWFELIQSYPKYIRDQIDENFDNIYNKAHELRT